MTSYECPGVSKYRQLNCLFKNLFRLTTEETSKLRITHHWSFVRGNHRWPVESPYKEPIIRKMFPCHDFFLPPCGGMVENTWVNNPVSSANMIQVVIPHRCAGRSIRYADSRFAPSQWETALLCNDVSHWLGASLESALIRCVVVIETMYTIHCQCLLGNVLLQYTVLFIAIWQLLHICYIYRSMFYLHIKQTRVRIVL